MTAILKITNGTQTINLLNESGYGIHYFDFSTGLPTLKQAGVTLDGQLRDGMRLYDFNYRDPVDTYEFKIVGHNLSDCYHYEREFIALLHQGADYFRDIARQPVWIEAKSENETETRYAIIKNYKYTQQVSPFEGAAMSHPASLDGLQVVWQRSHWQKYPPTLAPAIGYDSPNYVFIEGGDEQVGVRMVQISGQPVGTYNALNQLDSDWKKPVIFGNKRVNWGFSHVFYYRNATASFSANLVNGPFPFDMGAGIATGDAIYFGLQTAGSVNIPAPQIEVFFSYKAGMPLMTNVATNLCYWNGSAWRTAVDTAETAAATSMIPGPTVVNSVPEEPDFVHVVFGSDIFTTFTQATTTVNGVAGIWYKLNVQTGSGGTEVLQLARRPQPVHSDCVEISGRYLNSSVDALLSRLWGQTALFAGNGVPAFTGLYATRSLSRGNTFTPFVPFSTMGGSGVANPNTPIGTVANIPGATITSITVPINNPHYFPGRYRLYLRGWRTVDVPYDPEVYTATAELANGKVLLKKKFAFRNALPIPTGPHYKDCVDLGTLDVPANIDGFNLKVYRNKATAYDSALFMDFVLLPIDEDVFEIGNIHPSPLFSDVNQLVFDARSGKLPRLWGLEASLEARNVVFGARGRKKPLTLSKPIGGEDDWIRLFFFSGREPEVNNPNANRAYTHGVILNALTIIPRYIGGRGLE